MAQRSDRPLPSAPALPFARELHGHQWNDEYFWMHDHSDPRLLEYLGDERRYYDEAAAGWAGIQADLYRGAELRLPQTECSVSWKHGSRFYYTRMVEGSEYEQLLQIGDPDRVILDPAQLVGDGGYAEIGVRELSPDNRLLAYSVDLTGDEVYHLRFRDLDTLADLPEEMPRSYYTGAWSADSRVFFYTVHDQLFRPHQVWRHAIGTPVEADELVYEEDDQRFELTVEATRDGRWILIEARSRLTSQTLAIPADLPLSAPVSLRPRVHGLDCRAFSSGTRSWVFVSNETEPEFSAVSHPDGAILETEPGDRVLSCHCLEAFFLLELRRNGFPLLRAIDRATGSWVDIASTSDTGAISLLKTFEHGDTSVVVKDQSLIDPPAWHRVDLRTGTRELLRVQEVPGYDASLYRTRRAHAPAPDGAQVPVTLAWHRDTPLDGSAPAVLYGYGAYESCLDPEFDPMLPGVLDHGVVYAVSHPRGGGESGRRWWLDGRMRAKANTFTDHVAVAEWLGDTLADPARIATRGLSAGGLLQGAVAGLRPWAAVVAEVPFVDVVTSMLDPSIPLTINEWEEWGDPRRAEDFAWMRAYSPYDNLPAGPLPAMLVTGALHDPRVMVHEPAKWVARLRATRPAEAPLYLRVELGAGAHTGPSGRFAHLWYEAEVLGFVLSQLLKTES